MKFLFAIFGVYAFLILIIFPPLYLQYMRLDEEEFSRARLDIAVDYAGEGALRQALTLDDVDMDVYTGTLAVITPRSVASTFAEILLLNYDTTPTKKNVEELLSHVQAMMLTEASGYYLAEHVDDGQGNRPLVFRPQKPFYIDDGTWLWNSDIGFYKWAVVKKDATGLAEWPIFNGIFRIDNGVTQYGGVDLVFPKMSGTDKSAAMVEYAVWMNREVNLQFRAALARHADMYGSDTVQSFYVPMGDTETLVNSIYRSTFIVALEGLSLDGMPASTLVSINGMYADGVDYVVGWTIGTEKRYKLARLITDPSIYGITDANSRVFVSPEAAAASGYYPELN